MPRTSVRTGVERVLRQAPPQAGSYLIGFLVIAEYLEPDGERSLCETASEGVTPWQRKGYLSDALEGEGYG